VSADGATLVLAVASPQFKLQLLPLHGPGTPACRGARSAVPSREPSLTTMISEDGYVSAAREVRQSSIVSAASCAQTTTETSGHRERSS
jgi:hypothetical protein